MKNQKRNTNNLKPAPDKEVIRNDLNLEKWPIYTTSHRKGIRTYTRKYILPDGSEAEQKVIIGLKDSSETLTAEEGKIFYALLDLWKNAGQPEDGKVYTSLRKLLLSITQSRMPEELKKLRYGKSDVKWFKEKIRRMIAVPIVYEQAYKNKDGSTRKYESFTLISQADIFERDKTKLNQPYLDLSWFVIHPTIIRALREYNTKPLRYDVIKRLSSATAFELYRWLDLVMADKYELSQDIDEHLAKDIGLEHVRADHLIMQIRRACEEIEDKDITTGKITYCKVEKPVDSVKWKLVVKKSKQIESTKSESDIQDSGQSLNLVTTFLKEFGYTREPVPKELEQATELINRLGIEKAKQVVKYGIREMLEKYSKPPEWFGAVLTYESEALADLERTQQAQKQMAEQQAKETAERERRKKLTTVWIKYTGPGQDVKIAGSFNNWQPVQMGCFKGCWSLPLELPDGQYQYKLVIDGSWVCDPENPFKTKDDKGNENSVLIVKKDEGRPGNNPG